MPPAAGHNDGLAHGREADDPRQPVEGATSLLILMPVFNDWIAARKLLDGLDAALAEQGLDACILVVDDGSTVDNDEAEWRASFRALHRIDILRLRRNVGHQRAIAIGLAYVGEHMRCAAVVVMDSNGEDDPRDVPRLYRRCRELSRTADRVRRANDPIRELHVPGVLPPLQGRPLRADEPPRPRRQLQRDPRRPARVAGRRLGALEPLRGRRVQVTPAAGYDSGQSRQAAPWEPKMRFIDLVVHGLSAMAVYSEVIGVRLLAVSALLIGLAMAGIGAIVMIGLTTNLAIPGWATYTAGVLLIVLLQSILFSLVFSLIIISGRDRMTFVPLRDYRYSVAGLTPAGGTVHDRR